MPKQINITDTLTCHPVSLDTTNSSYARVNSSHPITYGYTDSSSTTYAQFNLITGSNAYTYIIYNFDTSEIPNGATINSVSCSAKAYVSSTSSRYISTRTIQMYSGTTAKGSTTTVSNSTSVLNLSVGNWTLSELQNAKIRFTIRRGTSSTSSTSYYARFYGATLTINYTISGTAYTINATSNVSRVIIDPATQDILAGNNGEVRFDTNTLNNIIIKDNGIDVTNQLVQYTATSSSFTDTFIPSSFDSTNSTYDSVYTGTTSTGLASHTNTNRFCVYANTANGSSSYLYYNFDCSSIPSNAIIQSVSCQAKGSCYSSGSYFSTHEFQLCVGTTGKGSAVTVTGNGSTGSTHTVDGGTSWTRSELDNLKLRFKIVRSQTGDASFSFWGATLTINYMISADNPYYWIYSLNNISADHEIIVQTAGGQEDTIYAKINGVWTPFTKAYKKINGSWVLQSNLTTIFNTSNNYRKGN